MLEDERPACSHLDLTELHGELQHDHGLVPALQAPNRRKPVWAEILQGTKEGARRADDKQPWPISVHHPPRPFAVAILQAIPDSPGHLAFHRHIQRPSTRPTELPCCRRHSRWREHLADVVSTGTLSAGFGMARPGLTAVITFTPWADRATFISTSMPN